MKTINLFAETIIARGYARSIIYDLPRNTHYFIPNSLHYILSKYNGRSLQQLYFDFKGNKDLIDEYLSFLKEKEAIFFATEKENGLFPKINLQWDYPAKISNAILVVNQNNLKSLKSLITQLIELNCFKLQIVSFEHVKIDELDNLLKDFQYSPISSIDIYLKHDKRTDNESIIGFVNKHSRIKLLFFHSSNSNEYISEGKNGFNVVYSSIQKLSNEFNCGNVHPNYFNTNIGLFTESQHYNTCLNRKICIDENGEIKNCPAMSRSFGNIKDTTLEEALNKPGFKDLWGIRKDDIDVCKDCEFRYMCTDCRCFIRNPEDIYSQPAKCTYNPYQALWQGEAGFISVEEWRRQNPKWEKKAKRNPLVKVPQKVE